MWRRKLGAGSSPLSSHSENLVSLDLTMYGEVGVKDWKALLEAIREKWPNLSRIRIDGEDITQEEYEKLLVSYGHQLKHLKLGPEEEISCGTPRIDGTFPSRFLTSLCLIRPHCPNMAISADLRTNVSFEDLKAYYLTPHITELEVAFDPVVNWEALELFANGLEKLKNLVCIYFSHEALHAFFATPKPSLEYLHLVVHPTNLDNVIVGRRRARER